MTPEDAVTMARRVAEIGGIIGAHAREDAELARERVGIIQVFRQEGWSFGRIAEHTGLSRSRVAQIAPVSAEVTDDHTAL